MAQRTTGTLGRVRDAGGAIVPSAKVHATEEQTGIRYDAAVNGRAEFTSSFLPAGSYRYTERTMP